MRVSVIVSFVFLALIGPALVPSASAEEGPDFTITLQADAPPLYDGPAGWFVLDEHTDGEHYAWDMDLAERFVVGDVRIPDGLFDVDRDHQVVPSVDVAADHYPLFHKFPRDDVWNADAPAQVYRFIDDGDDTILRLGFKGPVAGTFELTRDVTPPTYSLGPVEDLVHYGFYQQTTTDELARADLRVRPVDGGLERENPTPMFAYIQKFPVKGLDPETEYEARVVFEDWAGNNATSETYTVTTPPRPLAPVPTITLRSPAPGATDVPPDVAIEIGIESTSPDSVDAVRLFLDVQQIESGWRLEGDTLRYKPDMPLEDGPHRVSVEVYDIHGNMHHEQWTFWVGPGPDQAEAPAPALVPLVMALVALAALRRRPGRF